jgi:predicted ester cyclase
MSDERPGHPAAADVYRGFIDAVNRKDLDAAERFVDPERYRENCVGFTHGFVRWNASKDSIRQVWKGIPDLHVELPQILADESVVLAHGMVTGTATGRLYGAPATKRGYEASFFDFVRVDDGRIIERVQQADVLGQMRQLYGKGLGTVGLAAMFWRLLLPVADLTPDRQDGAGHGTVARSCHRFFDRRLRSARQEPISEVRLAQAGGVPSR